MPEIELKLAATTSDLVPVRRALLSMTGRPRAVRTTLTSTYYDTADGLLHRSGLSLRVRKQGNRYVQTVKAGGAAVPFGRGEWEDPIAGAAPDRAAPNSGAHLPEALGDAALHPLFTTVVRRAIFTIVSGEGTEIESALDEGEILAGDTGFSEPICEVELEWKRGDPAAIYDLGLRLAEVAPLRIEIRSKSERGYRLIDGGGAGGPQVVHPAAVELDAGMRAEDVLQKFGRDCLEIMLRNEPAALAGMPDGVHQMRVAIRRLRAALTVFKPMLPPEQYDRVKTELKWLAGVLAPARNWDVFTTGILGKVDSDLLDGDDFAALARRAEHQRRLAYDAAAAALRSQAYTKTMLEMSRWFAARIWRDQPVSEQSALLMGPIRRVAADLIAHRDKQFRKRAKGFADLDRKRRHRLRIAVKKLRYATELFESLFEKDEVEAFLRRLKPVQDELGHVNDVWTAGALIGAPKHETMDGGIERAAGIVLGWHERGIFDHEPKLRKKLNRFKRARPFW